MLFAIARLGYGWTFLTQTKRLTVHPAIKNRHRHLVYAMRAVHENVFHHFYKEEPFHVTEFYIAKYVRTVYILR